MRCVDPMLEGFNMKSKITGKVGAEIIGDSIHLDDVVSVYSTNEIEAAGPVDSSPVFRDGHVLEITTSEEGFNAGRTYLLKTKLLDTSEVRLVHSATRLHGHPGIPSRIFRKRKLTNSWQEWARLIRQKVQICVEKQNKVVRSKQSAYERAQHVCGEIYGSTWIQSFVAVLIVANMIVQIIDVEIHPAPGSDMAINLDRVDYMFTIVFAIELAMNLFANWTFSEDCCVPSFFLDGWNVFGKSCSLTLTPRLWLQMCNPVIWTARSNVDVHTVASCGPFDFLGLSTCERLACVNASYPCPYPYQIFARC